MFNVVFTGNFRDGAVPDKARETLARAFKTDLARIQRLFPEGGAVVRSNVDRATAEKYVSLIESAGALCRIEERSADNEASRSVPVEPAGGPAAERPLRVTRLPAVAPKLTLSPRIINRLSPDPEGININRGERSSVPFSEIRAVAALRDPKLSGGHPQLLFILAGSDRPYSVLAGQITFADFSDVKEMGVEASLRRFLNYLFSGNKEILFDEDTALFMTSSGQSPPTVDTLERATALHDATTKESGPIEN